jgi:SAM-dependent methyltransferase
MVHRKNALSRVSFARSRPKGFSDIFFIVTMAEQLNPSKLGTKQYWDDFYRVEKDNFEENPQDTGECWFADSDAQDKVVDFLTEVADYQQLDSVNFDRSTFIDLGTGNGRLLFAIRENGFNAAMTGLDYSETAVDFATMVAEEEGVQSVRFQHADFLTNSSWNPHNIQWHVVLDKGTLDAIALSSQKYDGLTGVERYSSVVGHLVKCGGLLVITSCNFTQTELIDSVIKNSDNKLSVWRTVDYPSFAFGGVKGQTVCTVAFIKR